MGHTCPEFLSAKRHSIRLYEKRSFSPDVVALRNRGSETKRTSGWIVQSS